MYIGEVIRRAQNYCPSEYDINEMYLWCDEVSSMLAIEDRNVFIKETLIPDATGRVLLPPNVKFENIISVSSGGRTLKKEDLRNISINKECLLPVELIYLKPYMPIRVISHTGEVTVDKENSKLIVETNFFKAGDVIMVQLEGLSKELLVCNVEFSDEKYLLTVLEGTLDDFADSGTAIIERVVTDKTVCDAPYDGMYIDYIIAKICMYQRDFNTYNQFMTSFNSRLNAYKKWITNQLPQAGGRLKNWW